MTDSDFSGLRAAVDRELAPLRRAFMRKEPPMTDSTEADLVIKHLIEQRDYARAKRDALQHDIERHIEIATSLVAERDAAARDVERLTMERDGWKAEHATLLNDITEHMQGSPILATERGDHNA